MAHQKIMPMLTMTHSKYYSCPFNSSFHLDTVIYTGGHWFLAENVVSLFNKRKRDFKMHVILNACQVGVNYKVVSGTTRPTHRL